jgi:parallel beta-helix repeat protein
MSISEVLPRSYGVWVASDSNALVIDNTIRNLQFGVCMASNATGLVYNNRFTATRDPAFHVDTTGVSAASAKEVIELKNKFDGIGTPAELPAPADEAKLSSDNG